MKNRWKVQIVTVLVLTVAAGIALGRKAGWRLPATPRAATTEQSPQAAIYAMLDAARAGDVKAYLASYTGPMEAALRQTIAETTEPVFAKYLAGTRILRIRGWALASPTQQKITDGVEKVRVGLRLSGPQRSANDVPGEKSPAAGRFPARTVMSGSRLWSHTEPP